MEPTTGLEPVTSSLPRRYSTAELRGPFIVGRNTSPVPWTSLSQLDEWSGKRDSNPQPSAWKADALPIELFPLYPVLRPRSPERHAFILVEGGGFEPPKASPTDLQSVPFGRSGTPPICLQKSKDRRQLIDITDCYRLTSGFRTL